MVIQQITESTVLRAVSDERMKLTDKDIFTSPGYLRLVKSIGKEVTGRTGRGTSGALVDATILWEPADKNLTAYTDNKMIVVNASNPHIQALKLRYDRHLCVIGAVGHEFAHCLFTDFSLFEEQYETLMKGKFYPEKPPEVPANSHGLAQMQKWLDKGSAYRMHLYHLYKTIDNTIEDAYIERSLVVKFPGIFKKALKTLNEALFCAPFEAEISTKVAWITFGNLLLTSLKLGRIEFTAPPTGLMAEIKSRIEMLAPRLERDVFNSNALARKSLVRDLMLENWDLLELSFADMQEQNAENQNGNGSDKVSGPDGGSPLDDFTPEQLEKMIQDIMEALRKGHTAEHSDQKRPAGAKPFKVLMDIPPQEADTGRSGGGTGESSDCKDSSGGTGGSDDSVVTRIFQEDDTTPEGGEELRKGLSEIENKLAQERAKKNVNESLQNMLQQNANESLSEGDNYGIKVVHMPDITSSSQTRYDTIWPELQYYAKTLKNEILKILKNRRAGGKISGLTTGRRVNSRMLYREDERYFSRNKLPDDHPRVAVSILIDQSGSMDRPASDSSGKNLFQNKIEAATNAALLLYDFCVTLGFPVMVAGHTVDQRKTVTINSFASFQRIDASDRFRITSATANGGNRDGTALNYCLCELKKRTEEIKLLFILSDGLPSDYHSREEGIEHLQAVVKDAKDANIQFYAAALDEDVETIQAIYGERSFEMTDLAQMPKSLLGIMKRFIK